VSNASHQPCNQMGAEPCSYNGTPEAGSDVRSAPLMPNSASKKCQDTGTEKPNASAVEGGCRLWKWVP
jgi:hypothetical protein